MAVNVKLGPKGKEFVAPYRNPIEYTKQVIAALASVSLEDMNSGDVTADEFNRIMEAAVLLEPLPVFVGEVQKYDA